MPDPLPATLRSSRLGGRIVVVVAVCLAGTVGVLASGLAWMLMGFMGTAVEPWEPIAYPAGAAVCVLVPGLVGGRLLGTHGGRLRWGLASAAATLVTAALVAVALLGITAA